MCLAIALAVSDVPTELTGLLVRRLHVRGEQPEYRFTFRDRRPRLPILRDGRLQVARWGNGRGQSRFLPRSGWVWQAEIEAGMWQGSGAIRVTIPATYGLERRGVWFHIQTGIRGILVPDEHGYAVAYMIVEPASHYYCVMTSSDRMPVLIDQRI